MTRVRVHLAIDFDWEPNTVLTPADVAAMIVKYGAVELGHKDVRVHAEEIARAALSIPDPPCTSFTIARLSTQEESK